MDERYELVGDERVFAGGGCMAAVWGGAGPNTSSSSGSAGPLSGDFEVDQSSDASGLRVVVRSGTTELARRHYDEDFLESGKVDRFQVTTLAGKRFELAYWGGHECDTSHVPSD